MTILVLDIGSSSVRALLFDKQARLIDNAIVACKHDMVTEPPGAAIFDMMALQASVEQCLDDILTHPAARDIRAVGVDTLVGNVVGVGEDGLPLTPVYTYADTRSAPDVAMLREQVDPQRKHQETGCLLHTAYQPSRLHWLRRTEPALYARVARWLDLGAVLYERWFGSAFTSYSVASWSGLFNRHARDWDEEWLRVLQIDRAQLPPLADYSYVMRGLAPDLARRWPQLANVPFFLPVGDGAAANVGSGCVTRQRFALTVGTTAALRTITQQALPPVPAGLWSYRVDGHLHLIGGATSEGGNIFQWARQTLALDARESVEAALATREPDSHGLTFLPLLAGERSPGWATDATGAVIGLRLSTDPIEIVQAALEGVAYRLALVAGQIAPIVADDAQVVASGGALGGSPAWTRMIATALERPLLLTAEPELTARGTAILALHALDGVALDAYPPSIAAVVEPRQDHIPIFRAARERQVALYQALGYERAPV